MNEQQSPSKLRSRRGFTLVELLVTMAIMAILASALAYVMAGAQEAAQIAKTKSLIARLHALVMQKYESYRYRRLPVAIPAGLTPRQAAQFRCDVIRQLMRLEIPERWTDIIDLPVTLTYGTAMVKMTRPACNQAYLAFFNSINVPSNTVFQNNPTSNQGAKCLYLLVTLGLDEPDVLENFSEGDIGDFDKTGCKVFLDAWGRPIEFLRWAPGFVSPIQPAKPTGTAKDYRMPDQTDPMGFYGSPRPPGSKGRDTFALYPLIYSAGADGIYDTVTDATNPGGANMEAIGSSGKTLAYSKTSPPNDPFVSVSDTTDFKDGPIGAANIYPTSYPRPTPPPRALGDSDNIHNHAIGAR